MLIQLPPRPMTAMTPPRQRPSVAPAEDLSSISGRTGLTCPINHEQTSKGFTLLELLIAMTIVAVLASVAYPAYHDHLLRARRAEAFSLLLGYAQRAEHHFALNNSYEDLDMPDDKRLNAHYTLDISSSPSGFTLSATASGAQRRDTSCITLSINHRGERTPSTCW